MDTPEAQSFVIDYLTRTLRDDGIPVAVSRPNPAPDLMVTVRREGGGALDAHRDGPGIGIYSWAPTEAKAAALAKRVSKAMLRIPYERGVARVAEEALYSAPDPESREPRWYGSYTLTTYQI
ncbi:MAG: hypothetical protein HFJ65_03405 [Eggerthellaceae bacterium]|nr:hypothetical protein [Eggerthellaceae bacterium]